MCIHVIIAIIPFREKRKAVIREDSEGMDKLPQFITHSEESVSPNRFFLVVLLMHS